MEHRQTTVNGVPNRRIEHGEGRPVVLVHGIPTSPRLWRQVMPLVKGRTLGLSSQADRLPPASS